VNAAVDGLFRAGATEVIVNDGHGAGYTLDFEELDPRIQVVHGTERPTWLPLLDERCAATALIGAHAMASSEPATCYHTMSKEIRSWSINGVCIGEMGLQALIAGRSGVPMIYVSGELHACEEIRRLIPGIVTTAVKRGLSRTAAVSWPAGTAREMIREDIQAAVRAAGGIVPLDLGAPILFRDERIEPTWKAEDAREGVRIIDEHTREIEAPDVLELMHMIYGFDPGYRADPLPFRPVHTTTSA
jgi:D-amino peptidase